MPPARRQPAALAPQKPLPMRTPLAKLGLTSAEARRLTPAARKVTKGDLVAMMGGQIPRAAQALTLRDLTSINQVLALRARAGGGTTPGCCCCCSTPCCCCCSAASVDPEHVATTA